MTWFKSAKDVTVGVVGYGGAFNMGKCHLTEMKKAGMTPVAVAELDPARLVVARQDFPGIETYRTADEMLRKSAVNLIVIITPHNTHAPLALKCLKAGRHVIVEKPMAMTTKECDVMIAAAKKSKVVLSTYHNRHWDGHMLGVLQAIRKGSIGEVVRVDVEMGNLAKPKDWWRTSRSISGGILLDWGVHLCEYILQIVDSEITEVSGFAKTGVWASQTQWKKDTNEDEGHVVVRFANGMWASILITSLDGRAHQPWFKIIGTKGTMSVEWGALEITTLDGENRVTTRIPNPPSEGWRFYQNVADHLTRGKKLVITPEWARRPIHILDLASQSAKCGHALKPKYK